MFETFILVYFILLNILKQMWP